MNNADDAAAAQAEAYALWGERIRLVFSSPPSLLEASLQQNPFERHSCCVPPASLEAAAGALPLSAADKGVLASARACSSYVDEEFFPPCFYARLLQSQRAAGILPADTLRGSASISTLLQTQRPQMDEEDVAQRLAERLRERAALMRARLQRLRTTPPGSLAASFCDPKVEKQQAQLHSELTAFLLEVRRENLASLRLRHQLQLSRALHP
ncbi:hypothetical protein LSCM1_01208 [Leishmania martiniquensis]|uniref:Uncharacterized protein n=1 Tax=Leishmania martiniquensis TaxID=1580590 RepID=A0A836GNE1_9TRYP|nr:hypothetical protein LSCM1_01208 [Leishmania martiniquensis]